jgi:hypothetical protein
MFQTIRYKRPDVTDEDGTEKIVFTETDKQTTPDRLTVLPWDEDAAFAALMCTKDFIGYACPIFFPFVASGLVVDKT